MIGGKDQKKSKEELGKKGKTTAMDDSKSAKKIDWNDPLVMQISYKKNEPKTVAQAKKKLIRNLKIHGN
ncbi:hypothetical protein Tco_0375886 [Tanacetum coccineum]